MALFIKPPMIGVTGTNGKTSSIILAGYIMKRCGIHPAVLDTWKGETAFSRFSEKAGQELNDCLLVEVPAEALRQQQLMGGNFQAGALTNLSIDHLVSCNSPGQYDQTKARFFSELPEGAKAIFNADDPKALSLAKEGHQDFITYALDYPNAMIVADNIRYHSLSSDFDLTVNAEFTSLKGQNIPPGSYPVHLPVPGAFNIVNTLLAATLSLLMNANLEDIAAAIADFPGIRRHMEVVSNQHFLVIDDSARNPTAIHAVFSAFSPLRYRDMVIVHGLYGGGGADMNRNNALELSIWLHRNPKALLIVTRSMYHTKKKFQVRLGEEKAFLSTLKEEGLDFSYFPDLPDALESAVSHVKEGALILLLGGAALNRARDLLLQILGTQTTSCALTPSEIVSTPLSPYAQSVSANPT